MKVAEPEVVRPVDNDGVGVRNVNAIFHYCRREQHVVVVVSKSKYDFLQFLRLHLPVADGDAHVRHILDYHVSNALKVAYSVVDEIDLSVSAHLEIYGIGNYLLSESVYLRLNRIAVGRRCLYHAHVPCSDKRELQRSRNRRCRHRERVNIGLHLSQLFFC